MGMYDNESEETEASEVIEGAKRRRVAMAVDDNFSKVSY
jgi:hypothetical protein